MYLKSGTKETTFNYIFIKLFWQVNCNSAEGGGRGQTHMWKTCKSSCQSERKQEESGLEKLFQLGTRCVCWSVGRVHRYQDVKVKFCIHEACKKDATLLYITTLSALSNLLLCSCWMCAFATFSRWEFTIGLKDTHEKGADWNSAGVYLSHLCCAQKRTLVWMLWEKKEGGRG